MLSVGCSETSADDVATTTEEAGVPSEDVEATDSLSSALPLADGASAEVIGFSNSGEDAPGIEMSVAFSSMACSDVIADADIDEFEKVVDMVADDSTQLCLVELVVTNDGSDSGWFSADLVGIGVTGSGETVPPADSGYDPALLAEGRETRYVGDGLDPGESAYDYVVYSLPVNQQLAEIDFTGQGESEPS